MTTTVERAYEAIRDAIARGRYEPGARLREEDLAEELGVSRTPVREALRRLGAEGIVDFEAHRGAQVAAWAAEDAEEIFELRALLEGFGARLAATRITEAELAHLEELARAMEQEVDRLDGSPAPSAAGIQRIAALNREFHQAVAAASRSPRVADLVGSLIHLPLVQQTLRRYPRSTLERSMAHHRELLAALAAHDAAWAESVMHSHTRSARAAVVV